MNRKCERTALNFQLPADGSVPDRIELLPGGAVVQGRDGRSWVNDDPAGVVAALRADGRDLPVDFEHATEIKAPRGEEAPAAAWLSDFEVAADGAIWGKAEWTPRGRAAVANREYRYLSPVLLYEKNTGRIRAISSVGLVNKPNLHLPALNRETPNEEDTMDIKKLLAKLGLPETANLDEALNAIGQMKTDLATALNRAETPSLDKFVPRADYDQAVAKAANAEQKLADHAKSELEKAINSEVEAALKAGKITPATRDYYAAMCRQEGGLAQFKTFIAAAPVIGDPSGLDGKTPDGGQGKALNAEQKRIAEMFGNSVEDLKKYGQA